MQRVSSLHACCSIPGIPESPALANTYYSQFDEDFTPSDEDENAETVIHRGGSEDDDDDIQFGSQEFTLKKDDEDEFFNHLQYVLDKDEDAGMFVYNINATV